jgi:myo-inositol-1(or 4)-monophosphatase
MNLIQSSPWYSEHKLLETVFRSLRSILLRSPGTVQEKEGGKGPVTDLDTLVDQRLKEELLQRFPEDGWLSEESPDIEGKGRIWVVDPIDGTRELVQGIPEWVISVALFFEGKLCAGWIYHPPSDTLWYGVPYRGAWKNETPIILTPPPDLEKIRIGVSRTDTARGRIPPLPLNLKVIGSIAYKLALLSSGELDAILSVTSKRLWDIAGGVAVVLGSGGGVLDLAQKETLATLPFTRERLFPRGFIASHPRWLGNLARLILLNKGRG